MFQAIFNYNGTKMNIQCKLSDIMKDIFQKYKLKTNINNDLFYLYNGTKVNEELKLEEIINSNDKNLNQINILVYDIIPEVDKTLKESKEIICPTCNENVIIDLKDYKLEMKCKNNHINKISFKNYNNKIDLSKIVCYKCNMKRSDVYKNEFYICLKCNSCLCPLCKSVHDQNHEIIIYDNKNYICSKHNENYTKYCCKKNICIECEKEHKSHSSIYYGELLPDNLEKNNIYQYIDLFKKEIINIINKLNDLQTILDSYSNIYKNVIDMYNTKRKNYELLQNLNQFTNFNEKFINDIKNVINNNDIYKKFRNIIDIYEKMNDDNINVIYEKTDIIKIKTNESQNDKNIDKSNCQYKDNDKDKLKNNNNIEESQKDKYIKPFKKDISKKYSSSGWNIWINNCLINIDKEGIKNALCGAAIYGKDGAIWAATDNLELTPAEIKEINLKISGKDNKNKNITIRELLYNIEKIEINEYIYLSRFDGGGIIGQTRKGLIIGIFSKNENCIFNGKEIKQNQELCNRVVKCFCEFLKTLNY